MTTNYTTLKLTEAQVKALYYAMYVATEHFNNYEEWEWAEFGHDQKVKAYEGIMTKLQKAGWE